MLALPAACGQRLRICLLSTVQDCLSCAFVRTYLPDRLCAWLLPAQYVPAVLPVCLPVFKGASGSVSCSPGLHFSPFLCRCPLLATPALHRRPHDRVPSPPLAPHTCRHAGALSQLGGAAAGTVPAVQPGCSAPRQARLVSDASDPGCCLFDLADLPVSQVCPSGQAFLSPPRLPARPRQAERHPCGLRLAVGAPAQARRRRLCSRHAPSPRCQTGPAPPAPLPLPPSFSVGNLPASVSEAELRQTINELMVQTGGTAAPGFPITSCKLYQVGAGPGCTLYWAVRDLQHASDGRGWAFGVGGEVRGLPAFVCCAAGGWLGGRCHQRAPPLPGLLAGWLPAPAGWAMRLGRPRRNSPCTTCT